MKLLGQLLEELGADTLKSITILPGFGCYVRSVKSVSSFSAEKIEALQPGFSVTISGEGLSVGEYFGGDLFVKGNVGGITVEKS